MENNAKQMAQGRVRLIVPPPIITARASPLEPPRDQRGPRLKDLSREFVKGVAQGLGRRLGDIDWDRAWERFQELISPFLPRRERSVSPADGSVS